MPTLLFYVSGHGYGHARRMTQVIGEILSRWPDLKIVVRTAAPPAVFQPLSASMIQPSEIDCGMVEADPLTIDANRTLAKLLDFMKQREAILSAEGDFVRSARPQLIVSDIPFLAGDVAERTKIRCIGISNFSWDWIYDELFRGSSTYEPIGAQICAAYQGFDHLLELPFGRIGPKLPIQHVPLIAPRRRHDASEILSRLGISTDDNRPRVLFGTRGGVSPQVLRAAAEELPDMLLVFPHVLPQDMPGNTIGAELSPSLDFSDLLAISDVVVSKLGYGIVSECVASRVRLVYPRRTGFAEDRITESQMQAYVPIQQIARAEYLAGRWAQSIRQVLEKPMPTAAIDANGAQVCAEHIINQIPDSPRRRGDTEARFC